MKKVKKSVVSLKKSVIFAIEKQRKKLKNFYKAMSKFKAVKIKMSKRHYKIVKREDLNGLEYSSEKAAMGVSRIYWSKFIEDSDNVWWYGENDEYVDERGAHRGYVVGMISGEMYYFGVEEIDNI